MAIPFFAFRIMAGIGFLMLALAWYGSWRGIKGTLGTTRWLLWPIFLSFPLGFLATLAGWYTAEVGRQPWTVYGVVRTSEAVTPFLTSGAVAFSLVLFAFVYFVIFVAGVVYIHRQLRTGPAAQPTAIGRRHQPEATAFGSRRRPGCGDRREGVAAMAEFWVAALRAHHPALRTA